MLRIRFYLPHQGPTSPLKSERGQMAIFIALIFQVLFVFFAMIVNVGLIVHDKINLQNSVDIAAYYAAQRQAEMLNAIAHQNYQIRQAWKLLAWRIRVLGDLGYKEHPMQLETGNLFQDVSAFDGGVSNGNGLIKSKWRPTVCVNHGIWGNTQNLCYNSKTVIPELPSIPTVNPFFPANFGIQAAVKRLKDIAKADCAATGPVNFELAIRWIKAYRNQVASSKRIIREYAKAMSENPYEFRDIKKNSVRGGTLKVLKYNLTRANLKSLNESEDQFRFFNSLGTTGKSQDWLNEVPIYPLIYYTDLDGRGASCRGEAKPIAGQGQENRPVYDLGKDDVDDFFRNEPQQITDEYHSTFGFEKNPWMMAYVGVYAETKPRKPYLPFGDPIVLKAKAFAKPFGGRIGPWYYTTWSKGKNSSSGNQKVDNLAPLPLDPSTGLPEQSSASVLELGIPNYSRFPGDTLGLVSKASLALFKESITSMVKSGDYLNPVFYSATPANEDGLAMAAETNSSDGAINKFIPSLGYKAPWIREIEVAAIAPDLFDATYYSVEVNSFDNYTKRGITGNYFNEETAPLDIGSYNIATIVNVAKQMEISRSRASENPTMNFWMIKEPKNLLTAWAPSGAFSYDFPKEAFGNCFDSPPSIAVPGMCARGGRVGYSVKIISEDYLKSDKLPLGGAGVVGSLSNPPPANF